MPHTKSAKKRHRQSEERRLVNRATRSIIKTKIKKVHESVAKQDIASAESQVKDTTVTLDRAAARGVIHKNAAARTKSRLSRALKAAKGKK
jgi:small subunit ribosomal protein S20